MNKNSFKFPMIGNERAKDATHLCPKETIFINNSEVKIPILVIRFNVDNNNLCKKGECFLR